ncbi:MAG: sugar phosphate isomerase/epimerase [Caldilineaceae bacterium]
MQVGLDAHTLRSLNLDPLGLLEQTVAHGLEGLHLSSQALLECEADYRAQFRAKARQHQLYLELVGGAINPGRSGKTVEEVVAAWMPLFPLAVEMGSPILNTCFGLLKERTYTTPTFAEQLAQSAAVLRALSKPAAEHDVIITVEIHVDLTSLELRQLIETVDSPYVQVNLDTANALGLLEDPLEAAQNLLPYIRTTHFKDTCVYPTAEGYNWLGGAPLGRGLVDLPAIVALLYGANPQINLNIEDSGGFIPIPLYDDAFLASFTDRTPQRLARFVHYLWRGEQQVRAGLHPRPEESKLINWDEVIPARLAYNADYARRVRDEVVAQQNQGSLL